MTPTLIGVVIVAFLLAVVIFRLRRGRRQPILIDGSNVMYWKDNKPDIRMVRAVVEHLQEVGFKPGVIFDANAGYLLTDKYRGDRYFARKLNLKRDQVMVVPKGEPADTFLLEAARQMNARIVTNDRFRDWADDYPEVHEPERLIRGGLRDGMLWFDI